MILWFLVIYDSLLDILCFRRRWRQNGMKRTKNTPTFVFPKMDTFEKNQHQKFHRRSLDSKLIPSENTFNYESNAKRTDWFRVRELPERPKQSDILQKKYKPRAAQKCAREKFRSWNMPKFSRERFALNHERLVNAARGFRPFLACLEWNFSL